MADLLSNSLQTTRYTNGSNYAYLTLYYTITPSSASKATVDWYVRLHTTYGYIVVGEILVKIAGNAVYHRYPEDAASASNNQMLASGTYTVDENPVDLYIGAGIYQHELNHFNSVQVTYKNESSWSLNTLNFTNPMVVGQEYTILNNHEVFTDLSDLGGEMTPGTCSTIKFVVGELEGTIAEKTQDNPKWTVPLVLFEMYPTKTTLSGYLHCDTYRNDFEITPDAGYTYLGRMSYPITVNILDGPKLDPEVRDINPVTVALTGDENKFVRFFSNAEFAFNATPGQGTNLVYYQLENDPHLWSQYSYEMETGADLVLNAVETGTFIFSVRDGRNYTAKKTLTREVVEYNKLTCNIWRIEATGDGKIVVGIGGDIFSASFGEVRNTLRISYRVKEGNGEFGEWQSIDYLNEDPTYEVTVTLENLDYRKTYTFEAMAEDKLMTVVSRQLPVRAIPVYDWGRDDFNVNVPFNMNHKTVLRHNDLANNVVLSASGGFIYFRPKGTDDNTVEVKISPQGNIELSGDILIEGQSLKSLLGI